MGLETPIEHPVGSALARLCEKLAPDARAQCMQDVFVLCALRGKRDGFFVEAGAANGVEFSNSYLLERRFGWKGILVEPSRAWHDILRANRPGTIVDTRALWSKTGGLRLPFTDVGDANLSTLSPFVGGDGHAQVRKENTVGVYQVETVSLNRLLSDHGAPDSIDYLSLDTEGSELTILQSVDFRKGLFDNRFSVITCEHNYHQDKRQAIHGLLAHHGYRQVLPELSKWDDWYLHESVPPITSWRLP